MENAIKIRKLPISERQCRFPDEQQSLNAPFPYSFSSCLTYIRIQYEIDSCNCTIHTSPAECISDFF